MSYSGSRASSSPSASGSRCSTRDAAASGRAAPCSHALMVDLDALPSPASRNDDHSLVCSGAVLRLHLYVQRTTFLPALKDHGHKRKYSKTAMGRGRLRIRALCNDASTPRTRHVRDSIDICTPRHRCPRRPSMINWQSILREWPDDDNCCPDPELPKVSKARKYHGKEGVDVKKEKVSMQQKDNGQKRKYNKRATGRGRSRIQALCHDASTLSPKQDSLDISTPKHRCPCRLSIINWQSILREWPGDDNYCPDPELPKVSKARNYHGNKGVDVKKEKVSMQQKDNGQKGKYDKRATGRGRSRIHTLCHDASSPRPKQGSLDICTPKHRCPFRLSIINWQSVLREWPDDDNCCPDPELPKVSKARNYNGNKGVDVKKEKVPTTNAKDEATCPPATGPQLTTVAVQTDADLRTLDLETTRVLLPSDLQCEALVSLLKKAKRRGFKQFVSNNAFRWALLYRYCSLNSVTSKTGTRNNRGQ